MATASVPTASRTSRANANYARVCRVVVEVFRDVLWDLLTRKVPASQIPTEVRRNLIGPNPPLRLFPQEHLILCPPGVSAPIIAREDCDTSLLYRLLRCICPGLSAPSKGWGNAPDPTDITVGDDVERIRQMRNALYGHVTSAELSDVEFKRHWSSMKAVCARLDALMGTRHCSAMDHVEIQSMDPEMEHKYIRELRDMQMAGLDTKRELKQLQCKCTLVTLLRLVTAT
jgi:hypothetical protein